MADPVSATLAIFGGFLSLMQGKEQAEQARIEAQYKKIIADGNERIAEVNASDAIRMGEIGVDNIRRQTSKILGAQKASYAGQGVKIDSDSARDVAADTMAMSELDIATTRSNARKAAWGYQVQGAGYSDQGVAAQMAGENIANNSILTGGMKAVGGTAAGVYGFYDSAFGSTKEKNTWGMGE